jgi:hypothetical protein
MHFQHVRRKSRGAAAGNKGAQGMLHPANFSCEPPLETFH